MALTKGNQGSAGGAPATTFHGNGTGTGVIDTAMLAAGWVYVGQKSAAIMGTTAACEVWASSGTVEASDVYTGLVVTFEVDDTNARIRVRCCEIFDSSLSATPSSNTKWACPGNTSSVADTPTGNYAINDSFVAHFQTQGNSAEVGWVNFPVADAGFAYAVGAREDEVLLANNSGGSKNWVHAGQANSRYLGTGGVNFVFLGGNYSATNTNCSWTYGASGGGGNYRTSKEPLQTGSINGPFCFGSVPTYFARQGGIVSGDLGGAPDTPHRWLPGPMMFQAYLCGWDSAGGHGLRSHLMKVTGFVCFSGGTTGDEWTWGDTFTADGVTYFGLGLGNPAHNSSVPSFAMAVREDIW